MVKQKKRSLLGERLNLFKDNIDYKLKPKRIEVS